LIATLISICNDTFAHHAISLKQLFFLYETIIFLNLGTIRASLKNSFRHLASTFQHLKHPYQILLIPFTLWSGLEQTYISAQFTKVKNLTNISFSFFFFSLRDL